MTIANFVPTVWAASVLKNLNDAHVYAGRCNNDYEGDVRSFGDTVKINSIGRITVSDYTRNSTISAPETLVGSQQILTIDSAKYFNFEIDNIDKWQAKPKLMGDATTEAAWAMSDAVDTYVAALMNAAVPAANLRTAATVGTGATDADMYEVLVDLDTILTTNNVPRNGNRWVVIAPGHEGLLRKDPRFVSFGTSDNRSTLRSSPITQVSGFDVYVSNNVPSGTDILAGYNGAVTFAEQIDQMVAFQPQDTFSDALKGLHVFGGTVTRPYGLAKVVATLA